MCLLIAAEGNKPSRALLERAALVNADGAGLAWVDGDVIRWEKSTDDMHIIDLCMDKHIRPPFLAHFRYATAGGVSDGLCHPFPVTDKVSTARKGTADLVLAHNGHWSGWQDHIVNLAARARVKLPGGPWSDTRALAWVAGLVGPAALDLIDEKVALLTPTGIVRYGGPWHDLKSVFLSNRSDLQAKQAIPKSWQDTCAVEYRQPGHKAKGGKR